MNKGVQEVISSLRFGDSIIVEWLDASEATGSLKGAKIDTPVSSWGVFLGIKGERTKHLIVAKEIVDVDRACHYNAVPLGMIKRIRVIERGTLDPKTMKRLKKFARKAMQLIRGKDGWVYVEGKNKKRIH
jgi:hypothetical protein